MAICTEDNSPQVNKKNITQKLKRGDVIKLYLYCHQLRIQVGSVANEIKHLSHKCLQKRVLKVCLNYSVQLNRRKWWRVSKDFTWYRNCHLGYLHIIYSSSACQIIVVLHFVGYTKLAIWTPLVKMSYLRHLLWPLTFKLSVDC